MNAREFTLTDELAIALVDSQMQLRAVERALVDGNVNRALSLLRSGSEQRLKLIEQWHQSTKGKRDE